MEILGPGDLVHLQLLEGVIGLRVVNITELTELVLIGLVGLPIRIQLVKRGIQRNI